MVPPFQLGGCRLVIWRFGHFEKSLLGKKNTNIYTYMYIYIYTHIQNFARCFFDVVWMV